MRPGERIGDLAPTEPVFTFEWNASISAAIRPRTVGIQLFSLINLIWLRVPGHLEAASRPKQLQKRTPYSG